jgi:hypothetical protein
MNFTNLDFLVYSSHKTSTQSLLSILNKNNYKAKHCHTLSNLSLCFPNPPTHETFIQYLIKYNNINKKKLKIISCVRNPKDRLLSSFFQSFSSDQVQFLNISEKDTIISVKNEDELCNFYEEMIKNKALPGSLESLDELSLILNINILEKLENKKDYYYLDDELFELFILDFNCLINNNVLNYLNTALKVDLKLLCSNNLSIHKHYYNKYKNVKKMLGTKMDTIIENQYNRFYFTAFNSKF